MQGSYVSKISKAIMKIVSTLMICLGIGTIVITLVYGTKMSVEWNHKKNNNLREGLKWRRILFWKRK